ncbi:hypothetical protein GO496_24005 [Acidovorax citrulli]|nr:hypothetical protein [Paracidovorax citrulli]
MGIGRGGLLAVAQAFHRSVTWERTNPREAWWCFSMLALIRSLDIDLARLSSARSLPLPLYRMPIRFLPVFPDGGDLRHPGK